MGQVTRSLRFLLYLVLPLAFDPLRCAVPRAESATTGSPPWIIVAGSLLQVAKPDVYGGLLVRLVKSFKHFSELI